jgi:dTDP-4-dehydrorhamnose reductase
MYIVIGANGFLGSYVLKTLAEKSTDRIIATFHDKNSSESTDRVTWVKCDVTNKADILSLRSLAGDVKGCNIFYFAACHNLDLVKREPELAKKINIDALSGFLEEFKDAKCLYFASTDCVYGENSDKYPKFKETDPLNPESEYGRQKLEGEKLVREYGFNVVRLPFMLGPSLLKHKKHFYDNIIEKSRSGEKITLADGLWRSALDYQSVADILYRLSLKSNVPQTLNLCGDDNLTKYDVGAMLEEKYGLPHENIVKVSEGDIQKFFFETRASSAVMDNSLLKSVLAIKEIKIQI